MQRVKRKTAQENVEYVLDDRFVLQEANGSDSTHPSYRRYHYGREPLAVADSGQNLRFLSVDALGSVSDFTTTSGTVYQTRQYDAWGQHRNGTAPAANQPKVGYTGHQFDPETGLVYARARYYDPGSGVFLSRDGLDRDALDAPWLHRYVWARGNPLRFFDPSGFAEEETAPVQAPQMAEEDESKLPPVEFSDQKIFEAEQRRAEAEQKRRDERMAGFEAQNAVCARNPSAKGCRYEGSTATESNEGPGTSQENDDPGMRELQHMREHRFDKTRAYARTGQQVTEAAMTMLPGIGNVYDLKLTVDEAKQGNWTPALIRAGIVLAPGAIVAVAKVGGKWVAKVVKAEAVEAKVVAKEAAAAEKAGVKAEKAGWQKYEEKFGGKQTQWRLRSRVRTSRCAWTSRRAPHRLSTSRITTGGTRATRTPSSETGSWTTSLSRSRSTRPYVLTCTFSSLRSRHPGSSSGCAVKEPPTVSSHEVPPFDVLAGARSPYDGFGPIVRGRELEERVEAVAEEALKRISAVFGVDIGVESGGLTCIDNVIQQMWRTGWEPDHGDVNLFARDFGSILILALHRELDGELLSRSMTDLSHASVWWPVVALEAFPFHKVYKALTSAHGESVRFYSDALRAKVRERGPGPST